MKCNLPLREELAPAVLDPTAGLRQVLIALAPGVPVSVARITEDSGMSRAMVLASLDALHVVGLPVWSTRAESYQLPWPLQLLDTTQIKALLPVATAARLGGLEVHFDLDSTSSELQRRGAGASDLSFVFAEMQSAGRGRRGGQWLSPPGLNILASCVKRFDCGVGDLAGLSLVVGLSVLRALEALGICTVGLKWPNDVHARSGPEAGGKLAGILIELGGGHAGACTAVVGVGMNLRLAATMRERVAQPASALASLTGGVPPERNLVAATLIAALVQGLQRFERDGFAPFQLEYAQHDLLCGRPLQITHGLDSFNGVGAGIDPRGALRVRLADGSVRTIDSAEITVRQQ